MKTWCKNLTKNQLIFFLLLITITFLIVILGYFLHPKQNNNIVGDSSINSSIEDVARKLGVTGKALAKELTLKIDVSKKVPISELGVSEGVFNHAVEHLLSHKDATIKYYIYFALVFFALFYILKLGKPGKLNIKERKNWYPFSVYIATLSISILTTGFIFGKSPNPMERIVKVFKAFVGLYPDPYAKIMAFAFFIFLAIIGNKLICGWACPFGAFQELIYSIPIFKKIKSKKFPFLISNSIRGAVFIVMLLILFGIIGNNKGMVIYHYINPFNLFNFDFDPISILFAVIIISLVSFIFYRPFCQFICPFGFVSWICERASIFKVKIDYNLCTNCKACIKACPTQAAKDVVGNRKITADCFSCTRCLKVCPTDAIGYRTSLKG